MISAWKPTLFLPTAFIRSVSITDPSIRPEYKIIPSCVQKVGGKCRKGLFSLEKVLLKVRCRVSLQFF